MQAMKSASWNSSKMTIDCAGDIAGCDTLHVTHTSESGVLKCDLHGLPFNKRTVCLLLARPDGLILGVTRGKAINDLGLPGGKVEESDDNDAAAIIRETFEETGIVISYPRVIHASVIEGILCSSFTAQWTTGIPRTTTAGAVMWAAPEKFVSETCTFRDYNKVLLKTAL